MDNARHGRPAAIVDIGHRPGDGTRGRNAAEQRSEQVGGTLRHQLGIRIVAVAGHTVGDRRRKQGFDSPQQRNGQSHGEQAAHHLPIHRGHGRGRQFGTDRKAVADGIDALHARIRPKRPNPRRQHDDGHQRPRNTAREPGCEDNQQNAAQPHGQVCPVDRTEMAEIEHPLADEIPRHGFPAEIHPEQVCDLRRENRQGDAGCEPHHDGIRNEPDDGTEFEQPHRNQQHAGHERRNQQPRFAVLLDDAVDNDDEGARRAADLYPASAQQRDDEPRDHSRDDSLFGRHARSDTEGDSQRQGHDAHNQAGHQVGRKRLARIPPEHFEEPGTERCDMFHRPLKNLKVQK